MQYLFFRKPLLPCILFLLLCAGAVFTALFAQSISDNEATVEDLYEGVLLEYQILPSAGSSAGLDLSRNTKDAVMSTEGTGDCCYSLECPYSLREPYSLPGLSTVYGTNSIDFFSENYQIEVSNEIVIDWSREASINTVNGECVSCIIDSVLVDWLHVQIGDVIVIASNDGNDYDSEEAPALILKIEGVYSNDGGFLDTFGIIVPSYVFTDRNELFYNANMMHKYYLYRTFAFTILKSYNREYQNIISSIKEQLDKEGNYLLYGNARVLERVVKPLEQKVKSQKMLFTPVKICLGAAIAAIAVFICVSFSKNVLIRLLWGETRKKVWFSVIGSLALFLIITDVIALIIVRLITRTEILEMTWRFILIVTAISVISGAVYEMTCCRRNLVKYLQMKEN